MKENVIPVDIGKLSHGLKTTFLGVSEVFGSIGAETVPGFGIVEGDGSGLHGTGNGTANVPGVENAADGVREGTDNVRDNSGDGSGTAAPDEAVKDAKDGSGATSEGIPDGGGHAAAADGSNAVAPDTAETSGQETPAEEDRKASPLTVDDLIRVAAQKIKLKKGNSEKIGALVRAYGQTTLRDLPPEKFEAFMTDLSQI